MFLCHGFLTRIIRIGSGVSTARPTPVPVPRGGGVLRALCSALLIFTLLVFNFSAGSGVAFAQATDDEAEEQSTDDATETEATTPVEPALDAAEAAPVEEADEAAEPEVVDEPDEAIEQIIVTGSRIRRDAFSASVPITVITAERSTLTGLADAGEILQGSALASGTQIDNTFGGLVVSGGPGVNTFGLRSLDAARTLVLVNGRRFTPAGVRGEINSVDLNTVPFIAIQRIEILKDGASSIYGADAVAGVVNVITRKQLDGLEMNASFRDESETHDASLLYGKTWDRGFFDFAFQYTRQLQITRSDRSWATCAMRPLTNGGQHPSIFGGSTPTGAPAPLSPNHPQPEPGPCFGSGYGYVDFGPIFAYDDTDDFFGSGLPFVSGRDADGAFFNSLYRDNRNWFIEDLIPEEELFQIYSDGEWDFDLDRVAWLGAVGDWIGTVSARYELFASRRENKFVGGYRQFFPNVSGANPTNQIGVAAGQLLTSSGDPLDSQPVVFATELLDPSTEVEVNSWHLNTIFEGDLGFLKWDLAVGYGGSRSHWEYETWLKTRVARALSAEMDADGNLVCTLDPVQLLVAADEEQEVVDRIMMEGEDPNCVPINLFTREAMIEGRLPEGQADYLKERVRNNSSFDLWTVDFFVEGGLVNLPAGEMRGVLGLEWRSRDLDDRPPAPSVEDNQWGFTSAGRTKGDDTVKEAYIELEAPLLAGYGIGGFSVAEELTLNYSWRYTDYSSYGSDTTYRWQLNWGISPLARVRASFGTSFRAPSLYELFLANQTGFAASANDPCNDFDVEGADQATTSFINCQMLEDDGIIPDDFTSTSLRVISGGNRDLNAETSDSFTAGLVLTPDLETRFPALGVDLSVAFDFYEIELENSITSLSSGTILSRCYATEGFTAQECALIERRGDGDFRNTHRDANGNLFGILSAFTNIALELSRGFDITVRADREFSFGDLSVDLLLARQLSYQLQLGAVAAPTEYSGHHAYAEWRGELDVGFDWKEWRFFWSTDYIGSTEEDPVYDRAAGVSVHKAERRFFHTASVRYSDPKERYLVTVGVRNLFDEEPPIVGWGPFSPALATNVDFNIPLGSGYDVSPRRLFITVQYDFF